MRKPIKQRIEPFLADLKARKITARDLANKLEVTESWVSHVLKDIGFKRTKQPTKEDKQRLREARLHHRLEMARTLPTHEAAKACNCHPRTITRLLKKA